MDKRKCDKSETTSQVWYLVIVSFDYWASTSFLGNHSNHHYKKYGDEEKLREICANNREWLNKRRIVCKLYVIEILNNILSRTETKSGVSSTTWRRNAKVRNGTRIHLLVQKKREWKSPGWKPCFSFYDHSWCHPQIVWVILCGNESQPDAIKRHTFLKAQGIVIITSCIKFLINNNKDNTGYWIVYCYPLDHNCYYIFNTW